MFDSGVILYGEIRGWSLLGRVGDCNLQCTSIYYPETENFDRNKKLTLTESANLSVISSSSS